MKPQRDLDTSLLSSSSSLYHAGPCDLESLIEETLQNSEGARFIIGIKGKTDFILWVLPTVDSSPFDVDDAVRRLRDFLDNDKRSTLSVCFHGPGLSPSQKDRGGATQQCWLLVATRFTGCTAQSIQLPFVEQRTIDEREDARAESGKARFLTIIAMLRRWRYLSIILGALSLLVLGVFMFRFSVPSDGSDHTWIRYDTTGSIGPKYQLQFSHHNVTEWAKTHTHGNGEWELRIDDQAMIPASLLDEEEERYQRWFRKHYPETNEIRLKQLYINESFLGDPYSIQVPADKQFHTAHCVLALRRYWKARESGTHVCPRDIDYRHMKHCLDSLDEIAFPDAEFNTMHHAHSGSGVAKPDEPRIVLLWKTKVCW